MRRMMMAIGAVVALGALASAALAADLPEIKKRGKLLAAAKVTTSATTSIVVATMM
jgi:hypothetical protein